MVKSPSGGCPAHKTADGRTVPIVNAQGHIVKGIKKAAAFVLQPSQRSSAQWPQQTVDAKCAGAATMGYKVCRGRPLGRRQERNPCDVGLLPGALTE